MNGDPPAIHPLQQRPVAARRPLLMLSARYGRPTFVDRIAKLLMIASLAAFALVVTLDNIVDYASNYGFVQHVLSMDDTFSGNVLRARAFDRPLTWHIAYILIIFAEGVASVAYLAGAVALLRNLNASVLKFERAKTFAVIGTLLTFMLWFAGFEVVGGEWFSMWQSKIWNGQEAAFRFYMTALVVLVFVTLPERTMQDQAI